MASNGFRFPPPPPPPPTTHSQLPGHSDAADSGNWRGRGRGRGNSSGRPFNEHRNGLSRGGFSGPRGRSGHDQREFSGRGNFGTSQSRGQKRRHDQAFARQNKASERPSAPPAVPSFGFDVNAVLPSQHASTKPGSSAGKKQASKRNVFGLAPSMDDKENDKDEDEESDLAKSYQSNGSSLQVSYAGQTMSLNTPEELAAWIAERKKRFPTKAKAEEAAEKAKREAEETAQKKSSRTEGRNKKPKSSSKENRAKIEVRTDRKADQARAEAQRLQKELEKAQKRVAELERAQRTQEFNLGTDENPGTKQQGLLPNMTSLPIANKDTEDADIEKFMASSSETELPNVPLNVTNEVDETSSSGASDDEISSLDDAPMEISSKKVDEQPQPQSSKDRPICRDFAHHGRCPRGRRCHFKHEPAQSRAEKTHRGVFARKNLYQKLQEQQQEMTEELVLQHILYLGDHGYLEEPDKGNGVK